MRRPLASLALGTPAGAAMPAVAQLGHPPSYALVLRWRKTEENDDKADRWRCRREFAFSALGTEERKNPAMPLTRSAVPAMTERGVRAREQCPLGQSRTE